MKILILPEGGSITSLSIVARDGEGSGNWYRETLILPALRELKPGERLEINFTGLAGMSVEALDEMFGMLVEENDYSEQFLRDTITFLPERRYAGLQEMAFDLIHAAHIEKLRSHGAPPF